MKKYFRILKVIAAFPVSFATLYTLCFNSLIAYADVAVWSPSPPEETLNWLVPTVIVIIVLALAIPLLIVVILRGTKQKEATEEALDNLCQTQQQELSATNEGTAPEIMQNIGERGTTR